MGTKRHIHSARRKKYVTSEEVTTMTQKKMHAYTDVNAYCAQNKIKYHN